jgi:hypothetical protein
LLGSHKIRTSHIFRTVRRDHSGILCILWPPLLHDKLASLKVQPTTDGNYRNKRTNGLKTIHESPPPRRGLKTIHESPPRGLKTIHESPPRGLKTTDKPTKGEDRADESVIKKG